MIMRHTAALLVAASLTAGCVPIVCPVSEGFTTSQLIRYDDQVAGIVRTFDEPTGLRFHIEAAGLPAGVHGVHVHAVGRCDPHTFASAGGHWNPTSREHGHANPAGFHAGDLGNVTVGADGLLNVDLMLPGAGLARTTAATPLSIADADGSALVIHAAADDERTDPSGNSGDRIACAVLAVPTAG
jgi:Cu-Zn family superoxide dismutase